MCTCVLIFWKYINLQIFSYARAQHIDKIIFVQNMLYVTKLSTRRATIYTLYFKLYENKRLTITLLIFSVQRYMYFIEVPKPDDLLRRSRKENAGSRI